MTGRCVICGDRLDRARHARGERCQTCRKYLRRTGRERPWELVMRLTRRDVERELVAERR